MKRVVPGGLSILCWDFVLENALNESLANWFLFGFMGILLTFCCYFPALSFLRDVFAEHFGHFSEIWDEYRRLIPGIYSRILI